MKTRKVLMSSLVAGNRFLHEYAGLCTVLENKDWFLTARTVMGNIKLYPYISDSYANMEVECCGRCIGNVDECGEDNYVPVIVDLAAEMQDKLSIPCSWSATNELRWEKREVANITNAQWAVLGYPSKKYERVLQQKWQGSDGSIKWEDVPVVDAAEKGNDNL